MKQRREALDAELTTALGGHFAAHGEDFDDTPLATSWHSPSGNRLILAEAEDGRHVALPMSAAGGAHPEFGPSMMVHEFVTKHPAPGGASEPGVAGLIARARFVDHQINVAVAWEESNGRQQTYLRELQVHPDNTASLYGVTARGEKFWFEHDSRGELTGYCHGNDSQKHPMDEIDMDAYAQRIVGPANHAHLILRSTLQRTKLLVADREQHNLPDTTKDGS